MITCHGLLLNNQRGPVYNVATGADYGLPEIRGARSAVETVYKIAVESVVGAPTTASLTFQPQGALTTSNGGGESGQNWLDTGDPLWTDLTYDEYPSLLPDGPFPLVVADHTYAPATPASRRLLFRRIRGGFSHRLLVKQLFTGGTSPGFNITVEYEIRY